MARLCRTVLFLVSCARLAMNPIQPIQFQNFQAGSHESVSPSPDSLISKTFEYPSMFKVQLHPPCTVKNTNLDRTASTRSHVTRRSLIGCPAPVPRFLNVPEESVSSDEELYTPFERCNMSAPPVLQEST